MLGGGLVRGTNTLLIGPSGVGKTTTAVRCMHAALQRGERAAYYLFDEGLSTLHAAQPPLGHGPRALHRSPASCQIKQIDPAELSPGEFASLVVDAVRDEGARFVALDSLNAYLQAMPGQKLPAAAHARAADLPQPAGVTTVLVLGQHGAIGDLRTEIDLSYLSDATVAFRFFEAEGGVRSAMTAMKSRTHQNERTIREFRISEGLGLQVGEPLVDFEGLMSGLPTYSGATRLLADASE